MLYYSYLAPNPYKSQLLKFLKTHSQNKFSLCSHLRGFILPNGFRYLGFAFASNSYSLSFRLFKNPNNFLILSTSYFINILKFSKKLFYFPTKPCHTSFDFISSQGNIQHLTTAIATKREMFSISCLLLHLLPFVFSATIPIEVSSLIVKG